MGERVLKGTSEENQVRYAESIRLYEAGTDLATRRLNERGLGFDEMDADIANEALPLVNQALELWPVNAMALALRSALNVRRGKVLEAMGDVETAIYIYNKAIESGQMSPDDPKLQDALQLKNYLLKRRRLRRFR